MEDAFYRGGTDLPALERTCKAAVFFDRAGLRRFRKRCRVSGMDGILGIQACARLPADGCR